MELTIIRHGQSFNNALMEDQATRVQDPPLTEIGKKQAECTAEYLARTTNYEDLVRYAPESPSRAGVPTYQFTHLYSSAMKRALQTAQPIGAKLGLKVEVWVDIHEHGGIYLEKGGVITGYSGMTRSEILAEFPDYILPDTITDAGWWKPENGQESYELAAARAMRVAYAIKERAQKDETMKDRVAIVAHGTFIDLLLKALLDGLPGSKFHYWHFNTGMTRMDIMKDGLILMRYMNRVPHLTAELMTT